MIKPIRVISAAFLIAFVIPMLTGCLTALKKANEFMMTTGRIKAENESDFQKARSEPFLQEATGIEFDNVVGQTYLSGICSAYYKDPQKAMATYVGKLVLVKGLYQRVDGRNFLLFDGIIDGSQAQTPVLTYHMAFFDDPRKESVLYFFRQWKPHEIHSASGFISAIVPYDQRNLRCGIGLRDVITEDELSSYISAKKHGREW